jgi:hypothetical protein
MRKWILVTLLSIGFLAGCITETITDPNSGQSQTVNKLDPNNPALKATEAAVEGIGNLLLALGVPIGTLVVGAGSVWKGLKPKIIEAQEKKIEAERKEALAKAAAQAVTDGVEKLKTISPESWEKLKPIYTDLMAKAPTIEAFVRELRGLPVDIK